MNLVVLSFVDPVKLMNLTTDSTTTKGIPVGMTTAVINYFQSRGVRVMMSIGGFSYTKNWDESAGYESDAARDQCCQCRQAIQCGHGD